MTLSLIRSAKSCGGNELTSTLCVINLSYASESLALIRSALLYPRIYPDADAFISSTLFPSRSTM